MTMNFRKIAAPPSPFNLIDSPTPRVYCGLLPFLGHHHHPGPQVVADHQLPHQGGPADDGDESAYKREVDRLAFWCSLNNLELNAQKTVEMTMNFRKIAAPPSPFNLIDSPTPRVYCGLLPFLGHHHHPGPQVVADHQLPHQGGPAEDGDESAYKREVDRLASWCSLNNLELNAQKTVEIIMDFRKVRAPPLPPHPDGLSHPPFLLWTPSISWTPPSPRTSSSSRPSAPSSRRTSRGWQRVRLQVRGGPAGVLVQPQQPGAERPENSGDDHELQESQSPTIPPSP
ncbi:uncharacterized protein LOC133537792 [Nerophis ophidion]|uniref:uncharacterized protein LOC133537792 n=1 Tax=Nerophis ophidion TaxID=159077 RepID=UPI002AE06C35|nr:uncharacterized protein LOC133537792 [Nerophis ophidion]